MESKYHMFLITLDINYNNLVKETCCTDQRYGDNVIHNKNVKHYLSNENKFANVYHYLIRRFVAWHLKDCSKEGRCFLLPAESAVVTSLRPIVIQLGPAMHPLTYLTGRNTALQSLSSRINVMHYLVAYIAHYQNSIH